MNNNDMREALSHFEVILNILQKAEDELSFDSGDMRRARGYIVAAQGVANSQIDILRDTLEVIGS